ncbi:hypothetical protein ACWKSX_27785 [Bacillus toyonensis]|nr:hypothetical protein CON62_06825 [Bacillus toyonensis]
MNTRWIELLDEKTDYERGDGYYFWEKTTGDCFKHLVLKYLESTNDSKMFFNILKQLSKLMVLFICGKVMLHK